MQTKLQKAGDNRYRRFAKYKTANIAGYFENEGYPAKKCPKIMENCIYLCSIADSFYIIGGYSEKGDGKL